MYGKNVLVYHIAPTVASSSDSDFETNVEIVDIPIKEMDFKEEMEMEYMIASASNADYETAVINRLDTISISAIFSACFLFLLLLRHRS